jgi:hypothetical protein
MVGDWVLPSGRGLVASRLAITPGPATGAPVVVNGAHISTQAPLQDEVEVVSAANRYSVSPRPSVRNLPSLPVPVATVALAAAVAAVLLAGAAALLAMAGAVAVVLVGELAVLAHPAATIAASATHIIKACRDTANRVPS